MARRDPATQRSPRTSGKAQAALIAILAGGMGRRLGGAKQCVTLAGRPLISYPITAAREASAEPVVIAKRDSPLPPLDCEVVIEPDIPRHPLCGIVTALEHGRGRPVVALGCDMPFVGGHLLAWIASLDGSAVACIDGLVEPLLGRWLPEQLPIFRASLPESRPLREVVAAAHPRLIHKRDISRFGDPVMVCSSVNDTAGLTAAERLIRGERPIPDKRPSREQRFFQDPHLPHEDHPPCSDHGPHDERPQKASAAALVRPYEGRSPGSARP